MKNFISRRSFIFTPPLKPKMFDKAILSGSDIVCLELEDGIPLKDKTAARQMAINIISDKFDFEFDCLSNKRLIELEINADSISQAIICGYGKNIIRPVYHQQHYGKKN